jgi:hypothetical protein
MTPHAPSSLTAHYSSHSLRLIFSRVVSEFFFGVTWHPSPSTSCSFLSFIPPVSPAFFHPPRFPPMAPRPLTSRATSSRSSNARGKRRGSQLRQATSVHPSDDDEAAPSKGPQRVHWNDPRTNLLIDWLQDNPDDRHRLFSDSVQNAKNENRARRVAKGVKSVFHAKIARFVFSLDPDEGVRADLDKDLSKYTKAVENRLAV